MGSTNPEFEALYRTHLGFVWRALRRFGVPPGALEDAAHEVFMLLLQKIGEIDRDRRAAWLYGTSRRVAANLRRSAERKATNLTRAPAPPIPLQPDAARARSEALVIVERFLETLPEPQREVFALVQIEGLTLRETAEVVGCPPGTANTRLRAARARLEQFLSSLHAEVADG